MTERSGDRSPRAASSFVGGLRRGALVFLAIAGVAEALALLVWAFGSAELSLGDALAFGWLELGAVHHVAIRVEVRDVVTSAGSHIDLEIGVALLTITVLAGWRLAAAGTRVAEGAAGAAGAGGPLDRVLGVLGVALGYAVPFSAVAPFIHVDRGRPSADLPGVFGISLVTWQALVFPAAIATAAAAGGLWWASARRSERVRAVTAGAGTAAVAAFALTFVALAVGGVVAPDGAIALTTPTTARYVRAIGDRPVAGPVAFAHHVALAPAEATWAFVPAMGGCVDAEGTVEGELLCYDRSPTSISPDDGAGSALTTPVGVIAFDGAPPGYLAFLLVPLVATVLGGRRAAAGSVSSRMAFARSTIAGLAFGGVVAVAAVLSRISIGYVADVAGEVTSGSVSLGPNVRDALLLGVAWGIGGGALGALVSRRERGTGRAARIPSR